jgi:hypothetical protein
VRSGGSIATRPRCARPQMAAPIQATHGICRAGDGTKGEEPQQRHGDVPSLAYCEECCKLDSVTRRKLSRGFVRERPNGWSVTWDGSVLAVAILIGLLTLNYHQPVASIVVQLKPSGDHAGDAKCHRYVRHAVDVMHIVVFMFGCPQNWLPLFPGAHLKQLLYLTNYLPVPARSSRRHEHSSEALVKLFDVENENQTAIVEIL